MSHCDCAYIAPEVIRSGVRCNQCVAALEALSSLEEVADKLEYLDRKGWQTFMLTPRVTTLIADLRMKISGQGPPKRYLKVVPPPGEGS